MKIYVSLKSRDQLINLWISGKKRAPYSTRGLSFCRVFTIYYNRLYGTDRSQKCLNAVAHQIKCNDDNQLTQGYQSVQMLL